VQPRLAVSAFQQLFAESFQCLGVVDLIEQRLALFDDVSAKSLARQTQ
jgi:hypothetical protein